MIRRRIHDDGPPVPASVRIARLAFTIFALAFVLLPIAWLALGSLKTRNQALALPPQLIFTPSFDAYSAIVAKGFLGAFQNSLIIALSNVVLTLLLGTPAAYALARMTGKAQDNLSFWVISVRMAPVFAVILPLYVLFKALGLLDTRVAVSLAHLTLTLPLAVWMLLTYFRSIPEELDQAAMLDGAGPLQILLYIIVPIARPMLASVAIVVFIFSWNEFLLAFVLTARGAQTVPVAVASLAGTMSFDWPLIAAVSICSMIPALIFVGFAQRHIVAGLASGAVK
ncbi:multiple sugar transport system permease protein [Kaistia hirudinis]|jgi:multiple sugar transport system permease protein|uniref:Multiple sugar transport system permease protein n=1 Tax=Kaistia hirudinis TaxID=1293440 RepID=A0A840AR70_9HYPH|nr:carbohydrate ABC transporter permease [Kaistia hirudinis]MBB3931753.1 multiple sugar transport system permease protein [Kaistia hirudinis]MBN9016386.1 carbohydrate ABC transporter permease [Hyphomicrobiales bacterium]